MIEYIKEGVVRRNLSVLNQPQLLKLRFMNIYHNFYESYVLRAKAPGGCIH